MYQETMKEAEPEKYSHKRVLISAIVFGALPVTAMELLDPPSKWQWQYGRLMEGGIALNYAVIGYAVGGILRTPKLDVKLEIPRFELSFLRVSSLRERFLPQFKRV